MHGSPLRAILLALLFIVRTAAETHPAETRHYLRRRPPGPPPPAPPEEQPPPQKQLPPLPQKQQQKQQEPNESINATVKEDSHPGAKQQTTVSAFVNSPAYRRPPYEGGGGA
jgi:hypothetical protein